MKRSTLLGALAVAGAVMVGAGAVGAAEVNMKIAHVVPQKAPRGQGAAFSLRKLPIRPCQSKR